MEPNNNNISNQFPPPVPDLPTRSNLNNENKEEKKHISTALSIFETLGQKVYSFATSIKQFFYRILNQYEEEPGVKKTKDIASEQLTIHSNSEYKRNTRPLLEKKIEEADRNINIINNAYIPIKEQINKQTNVVSFLEKGIKILNKAKTLLEVKEKDQEWEKQFTNLQEKFNLIGNLAAKRDEELSFFLKPAHEINPSEISANLLQYRLLLNREQLTLKGFKNSLSELELANKPNLDSLYSHRKNIKKELDELNASLSPYDQRLYNESTKELLSTANSLKKLTHDIKETIDDEERLQKELDFLEEGLKNSEKIERLGLVDIEPFNPRAEFDSEDTFESKQPLTETHREIDRITNLLQETSNRLKDQREMEKHLNNKIEVLNQKLHELEPYIQIQSEIDFTDLNHTDTSTYASVDEEIEDEEIDEDGSELKKASELDDEPLKINLNESAANESIKTVVPTAPIALSEEQAITNMGKIYRALVLHNTKKNDKNKNVEYGLKAGKNGKLRFKQKDPSIKGDYTLEILALTLKKYLEMMKKDENLVRIEVKITPNEIKDYEKGTKASSLNVVPILIKQTINKEEAFKTIKPWIYVISEALEKKLGDLAITDRERNPNQVLNAKDYARELTLLAKERFERYVKTLD